MKRTSTHSDEPGIRPPSRLTRRFIESIGLLVVVVLVSTVGFFLQGRPDTTLLVALWETLNLISTVGSLPEFDTAERVWAMLVIAFGLGATLYAFGNLTALLTSGEILHVVEERKMEKQIRALHDHIIICGYGNTGRQVATSLAEHHSPMVIIEQDEDAVQLARSEGHLVLSGECTQESVLRQAGIDRARGLVAALTDDATNVFAVLTARGLKPDLHIVSRAESAETVSRLERAGANQVTVPTRIAARQMADASVRPELGGFMTRAMQGQEVEMLEVRVSDYPWMAGRTLRELALPRKLDMIIFAMIQQGETQEFNPKPDTEVNSGDLLLVVARRGAAGRLGEMTSTRVEVG